MKAALRVALAIVVLSAAPAARAELPLVDAVVEKLPLVEALVEKLPTGLATYYAHKFEGRRTASGEPYRGEELIAAHPTFPLGTVARVTHLATGRSVDVRIIDRGPAPGPQKRGVIIDLSHKAARHLDMIRSGIARVKVEVLHWGTHAR